MAGSGLTMRTRPETTMPSKQPSHSKRSSAAGNFWAATKLLRA